MNRVQTRGLVASLMTLIAFGGCSNPSELESSMPGTDSASAQKTLEQRVKATIRFREVAKRIEDALEPVDATLTSVRQILELEGQRVKGEMPRFAVSELRHAMRSLAKEVVEHDESGNWVLRRTVEWPFERQVEGRACNTSTIEMRGGEASWDQTRAGAIAVYVKDCAVGEAALLASVTVDGKGGIHADFDSASAIDMKATTIQADRCLVEIASTKDVAVECKPFTMEAWGTSMRFDSFSYLRSGQFGVEQMSIVLKAFNLETGSPIAGGSFVQNPGERVKFQRLPKESL
jgi:hypothetical protein